MNTTTKTEQNALTLPERAAVALGSSKTEIDLHELVKQSTDIVAINSAAGRDQAHRIGMNLKTARVAIEKTGKAAREDAVAFGKAIIAEERRLIGIVESEEARVFDLRDTWDAKIEAERQAKIDAEIARTAKIADRIAAIREDETDAIRIDKTAEQTGATLAYSEKRQITLEIFQERLAEAQEVHAAVLASIRTVLAERVAAEEVEAARIAAAKAEAERLAAEREELAKLRAEAAERERLAKAEADRVAAAQAAEAARLRAEADAQAAAVARQRKEAEDALRAQADAQAAQARKEQTERDRVAAEVKSQLEQQAAQVAADRKALEDERAKLELAAAQANATRAQAESKAAPQNIPEIIPAPVLWPVSNEPAIASVVLSDRAITAPTTPPTLRLGQIAERLGFTLTADFLRTLGFEPAARDKAAVLYHERDFTMICAALNRHISAVQAKLAA